MPPDCYKVQVLYYLNPHLIWVEVRDPEIAPYQFKFEQIGIYGLLPLETTINLDQEEFTVQRCTEWQPAATAQMYQFLQDSEVWFTPIHIDNRSSVFDSSIHKFGDLLKKNEKGRTVNLSKMLRSGGFATYDACLFHQQLSEGKIKTKLNNAETQNVITNIENFYRKFAQKKNWEKPVRAQTSVSRAAIELEAALTASNLNLHNNEIEALIENKNKDLQLCKDVEERSVGRGSTKKENKPLTLMEKKLEILNSKRNENVSKAQGNKEITEHVQAFEETKAFLESNATPSAEKISDRTNAQKAQILKKIMCKSTNKVSKQELLVKQLLSESQNKSMIQQQEDENLLDSFNDSGSQSESSLPSSQNESPSKVVNMKQHNTLYDEDELVKPSTSSCVHKKVINGGKQPNSITEQEQLINPIKSETIPSKPQQILSDSAYNEKLCMKSERCSTKADQKQRHSTNQINDTGSKENGANSIRNAGSSTPEPQPSTSSNSDNPLMNPIISNLSQNTSVASKVSQEDEEKICEHDIHEQMVEALLSRFDMRGPKHSNSLRAAIKKCKEMNDTESLLALQEFRRRIIGEIKSKKDKNHYSYCTANKKSRKESKVVSLPPARPTPKAQQKTPLKITSKIASKSKSSKNNKKKEQQKTKGKRENGKKGRTKTAYGPPGFDLTKLNCRVPPIHPYGDDSATDKSKGNTSRRNNSQGDSNGDSQADREPVPSCSYNTRNRRHKNDKKNSSSSCSSVWEKRLKLHKEMAKHKRNAFNSSDSTNKDTSNTEEKTPPKNKQDADVEQEDVELDESITELIEMINIYNSEHPITAPEENVDKPNINHSQQVAVKANPFQNCDPELSVFVEQLVTPIMMVHSKMNKRIVPISHFRDMNFTEHIRLVLQKLSVTKPMMMQSITWPAILRGYSVFMVGAPNSGKTIGYLPAVCRLVTDYSETDTDDDSVGPICIIICATSRSVTNIFNHARMMLECDQKVISLYFGHDEKTVAMTLLNGCEILVCTAPSLVRLLQMNEFGVDLRRLSILVLDDCERLSEVYPKELKFCLYKVKDLLKTRVNKELKVQYVVASRIWCNFMEPLAKKAPDTVVCIGAFQESVVYAKANMKLSYVKKENKLNLLIEFLKDIDPSKKAVVVCDTDEEVEFLNKPIQNFNYYVFACNSKMTVQELYNLSFLWREFKDPARAAVLICCDSNLFHMNIVNAHYLVQYSMPSMYSTFCRRFATLNESYPSIFRADNESVKILIILEETNVEQLPKILNFVKRCTENIPEHLDDVCRTILKQRDFVLAENYVPLCNDHLNLGYCPDINNCKSRHTLFKYYDMPKKWIPTSGTVTFKILHYGSAVFYTARLLSSFDGKNHFKYPQTYSSVSMKMGMHYSKERNKILLGIPKLGDICAVARQNHLFARCQVIKIVRINERGQPANVLVSLIDEEILEVVTDTDLYYLPEDLKDFETYVVKIRLANIQPRDKDILFSKIALDHIKAAINEKENIYVRGQINLVIGNNIFVDTLEACEDLKSLKETVVTLNIKRELLEKHGEVNPDHITKLQELCRNAEIDVKPKPKIEREVQQSVKIKPQVNWAYLDRDTTTVFFRSAEDPDTFFVRLTKFEDCFKILIKDVQNYVAKKTDKLEEFTEGDIVLAEYPDDAMYERARIDQVDSLKVKCFFVDQGECRWIAKDKFFPIDDGLISQLPFQAIECRLVGIKPPGNNWSDFATNWLFDKCFEDQSGGLKHLYIEYFTKEPIANFTGGHKYGVTLIDTYGDEDIIINQLMIDLNLAQELDAEMKYLAPKNPKPQLEVRSNDEDDEDWEKVSKHSDSSNRAIGNFPSINRFLSEPIRSVPLVQTDDESDDSEKWQINLCDDIVDMFRPMIKNINDDSQANLPAIESIEISDKEQIDFDSVAENIEQCTRQFQLVKINPHSKELDSDDLSSSEDSEPSSKIKISPIVEESQLRKPKLNWRQTKSNVLIKIQLIGVENYDIEIQNRSIKFAATVNDTDYGFEFDLYGVIDSKNAIHSNKGQYIIVKFNKLMSKNWLTLTKDGGIRKWIVYDVDSIDTSSDEEEVQGDNLVNIVKNMHNRPDSDSDDEFADDVNYTYKRD